MTSSESADKIKFIYLANDVLLQCGRKAPAYLDAFKGVLIDGFTEITKCVSNACS